MRHTGRIENVYIRSGSALHITVKELEKQCLSNLLNVENIVAPPS